MPGRKIPLVTGEYYHIFNRGVNKTHIFENSSTYRRCINQINYYRHQNTPTKYSTLILMKQELRSSIWDSVLQSNQKHVEIIAFCLMPNHFHFLLKQLSDYGIAKFMSNFQNSYSRYYNTKFDRSGPLLTGKFQSVRVENDEQLLHVSRYIHLNPLIGHIVSNFKQLKKYKWSSLPQYFKSVQNTFCSTAIVENHFKSVQEYFKFMSNQVEYARELEYLKKLSNS